MCLCPWLKDISEQMLQGQPRSRNKGHARFYTMLAEFETQIQGQLECQLNMILVNQDSKV